MQKSDSVKTQDRGSCGGRSGIRSDSSPDRYSGYLCGQPRDDDVVLILDLPNRITAAALSLTISGAGAVRVRTAPLLTVEDVDQALEIKTQYRAPGE